MLTEYRRTKDAEVLRPPPRDRPDFFCEYCSASWECR